MYLSIVRVLRTAAMPVFHSSQMKRYFEQYGENSLITQFDSRLQLEALSKYLTELTTSP